MFTLDSDVLGLMMALLTFLVPVITSVIEIRKKKRRDRMAALQQEREEFISHRNQNDGFPDESVHNGQDLSHSVEEEGQHHTAASELEELFNDILGLNVQQHSVPDGEDQPVAEVVEREDEGLARENEEAVGNKENAGKFLEGEAATLHLDEEVATAGEEILKEIPQEDNDLKKRIKENPKDMVIFAEILKPKFKEY